MHAVANTCQNILLASALRLMAHGCDKSVVRMNLACSRADPGSWGVSAASAADFANRFLESRAAYARAANKPWMLEEVGMEVRKRMSRGCIACIGCCPFPSHVVANEHLVRLPRHRTSLRHTGFSSARLSFETAGCHCRALTHAAATHSCPGCSRRPLPTARRQCWSGR